MKLLFTVSLIMFSAFCMAQSSQQKSSQERLSQLETREAPNFLSAKEHSPLAKTKAYQRVAILNILLSYEKGKVVGAKLVRSQKVASVAPKVFARQIGDWQVVIDNNQKTAFFVNNPGFLEAENDPDDKIPYHYVSRGNEVKWNLVVPLYKNGKAIDASTITIKRVQDGELILQTKI